MTRLYAPCPHNGPDWRQVRIITPDPKHPRWSWAIVTRCGHRVYTEKGYAVGDWLRCQQCRKLRTA